MPKHALDTLVAEHDLIWTFLDVAVEALQQMESGENPPRRFFDGLVEFARDFVDRFHHGKEEHQTFTLLASKQHGALDPHMDILNQQHDRGRRHVTAIASALDSYAAGEDDAVDEVMEHTAAFTSLLRLHIHREDNIFFPLAREQITPEEGLDLEVLFRQIDECMGDEFVHDSRRLVEYMRSLLVRPANPERSIR